MLFLPLKYRNMSTLKPVRIYLYVRGTNIIFKIKRPNVSQCTIFSDENNNGEEGEPEFTSMINLHNPLGLDGVMDDEEEDGSGEAPAGTKRQHDGEGDEILEVKKPKFEQYHSTSYETPPFG